MSKPSFTLFRRGPFLWARFKLATGKEAEFSTGTSDKAKAEGIAEVRVPQKIAISRAGMKRWEKKRGTTAAIKRELGKGSGAGEGKAPTEPASGGVPKVDAPPAPAPPPSPAPAPEVRHRPPPDAAALGAKLRSLGGKAPVATDIDAYIPPGDKQTDEDAPAEEPIDPNADNEAGELLADMLAVGTISLIVRANAKIAKKRKPPVRLAEPNERMTDWTGKGLSHNYRKLVGNAGALSPTGKMLVGIVGMTLTMWWDAEEIGSTPGVRTEQTTSPTPAPARVEVRATNGASHGEAARAPAPAPEPSKETPPMTGELALGRFS